MTTAELRVSTASPTQWGRVLSIEVPRERWDAVRADVARDLRRKIVRPGFRRGHVPAALVEREFGPRIENDALEKFLPQVCGQAIESESLDVISSPRVRNLVLDDPQVVRLEVALDVRPKIDIAPLDQLRGAHWKPEATDEDLVRALDRLREEHAQYVEVERAAQDGDFVQVSFVPLDAAGREMTAQKTENHSFQLGAGGSIPQFEAAVRGLAAGATAQPEVNYPADHPDPALAGRAVAFVLTVGSVKEKRVPVLDDEFARDLGFEDLTVLRTQARSEVERRLQSESERSLRDSLVDSLLQANPFEAPESMVEQAIEHALTDYDRTWQRIGMEPDPEHRQEYARATRPAAERIVKRALVLESLSAQHDLHVAEEDVDRWIEDKVLASGSGASEVRAFFTDVRRRRRLRSELTDDKVFEFLKGKAEITEVQRPADPPAMA